MNSNPDTTCLPLAYLPTFALDGIHQCPTFDWHICLHLRLVSWPFKLVLSTLGRLGDLHLRLVSWPLMNSIQGHFIKPRDPLHGPRVHASRPTTRTRRVHRIDLGVAQGASSTSPPWRSCAPSASFSALGDPTLPKAVMISDEVVDLLGLFIIFGVIFGFKTGVFIKWFTCNNSANLFFCWVMVVNRIGGFPRKIQQVETD